MGISILAVVAGILILTTIYVVVRTLIFQWSRGSIETIEGMPVDEQQVAEHLAASMRCRTVPQDEQGTPDPEAFRQLHQMLEETYPLVHSNLKREVVNGYSLLYTWPGRPARMWP